jgi:hypothetical protein
MSPLAVGWAVDREISQRLEDIGGTWHASVQCDEARGCQDSSQGLVHTECESVPHVQGEETFDVTLTCPQMLYQGL